jgi:hypothetical protein
VLPAVALVIVGFAIGFRRWWLVVAALVPATLFALSVDEDADPAAAFVVTYVIALFLLFCGALVRRLYAARGSARGPGRGSGRGEQRDL